MLNSTRSRAFILNYLLKRLLHRVGGLSILTILVIASASGQTFRGGIQGVVTDPNAAVMPAQM